MLDPPFQDVERLKADKALGVLQTADLGQQYFTFDQWHDELEGSDVKGPKSRSRTCACAAPVYQGDQHRPDRAEGAARAGRAHWRVPLAARRRQPGRTRPAPALRPGEGKALLAEAGYPNGFSVTLDCVNIAYRENVCQAAAAMFTQAGIRTTLRSLADEPVLSAPVAGYLRLHRVRLDADDRCLGDAERARSTPGAGRRRHVQRRALLPTRRWTR